jgi:hypothetical protein
MSGNSQHTPTQMNIGLGQAGPPLRLHVVIAYGLSIGNLIRIIPNTVAVGVRSLDKYCWEQLFALFRSPPSSRTITKPRQPIGSQPSGSVPRNHLVSKETFQGLFGTSGTDVYDFSALDTPLPHPVYWAQSWVSVLNPGPVTSDLTRSLLTEAMSEQSPATSDSGAARAGRDDLGRRRKEPNGRPRQKRSVGGHHLEHSTTAVADTRDRTR